MTKREYFEAIKNVEGVKENADFVAFLDKQIELVSKKRTSLTPVQKANAELVEQIYAYIVEVNGPVTIADIMAQYEGMTNQKASALVKKLVDAGKVEKAKDGKKTIYTIAD